MPSVSTKTLQLIDSLAKEHNIKFVGDLPSSKWPERHKDTLGSVIELGERKFDSFATEPNVTSDEPWKVEVKSQAALLVARSRRCHQRNESSWRFACEPFVFARLEAEVACKNCRKRIWRSEIEARREEASAAAAALQRRQQNREPCRCSRMARSQDYFEAVGLNNIFGHREDEQVDIDPVVAAKLSKDFQKPDTIFGLRETRNIQNLLNDTRRREFDFEGEATGKDKQLHELLDPWPLVQPIIQKGDKLLYPFLILEAKSGTSESDWYSIQMQTTFPIKALLDTQDRLRKATGRQSKWHAGPLVWFFANRGEDWRLSAAYMEQPKTRSGLMGPAHYRIVDLWRGSISTRNGALQLLLLVDYIFDWARDIYRDHVIQELRILASGENDASSIVYSDTEIYSTRQVEDSDIPDPEDVARFEEHVSNQKQFIELDSAKGVVRHATFIESKFCLVFVTPDNVSTLLQSTRQTRTQQLCRYILKHMSESMLLDLPTLVAMEKQWTGNSRLSPPGYLDKMGFYSVVSCTNYLSGSWHQVREVHIVAIAEGAWDSVVEASKLKKNKGKAGGPLSLAGTAKIDSILETLKQLQAGSIAETLHTAITRRAVKICNVYDFDGSFPTISGGTSSAGINTPDTVTQSAILSYSATCKAKPDDGEFRDIVHYIYKFFKKGNIEPQESFMRVSKRFDQQHLLHFDVEPIPARGKPLQISESGCVLISSSCHSHDPDRSKSGVCIYVVEGEPTVPSREQLFERLTDTVATRDVYHTTQDNGTSNLTDVKKVPWNLQETYGIYSGNYEFLKFIAMVGKGIDNHSVPSTQGSLRLSADSGSYLFTRNLFPWQDLRRIYINTDGRSFTMYKLMASDILYWRATAAEMRLKGVACCNICATLIEVDTITCSQCTTALREYNGPDWVVNLLQGRLAFPRGDEDRDSSESAGETVHHETLYKDRWQEHLAGYPRLDMKFKDLFALHNQYERFLKWSSDMRMARNGWGNDPSARRKRLLEDVEGEEGEEGREE